MPRATTSGANASPTETSPSITTSRPRALVRAASIRGRILLSSILRTINVIAHSDTPAMSPTAPGNVRELKALIRKIRLEGEEEVIKFEHSGLKSSSISQQEPQFLTLNEMDKRYIKTVFRQTGYRKKQTAKILGIGLNTLKRKLTEISCYS